MRNVSLGSLGIGGIMENLPLMFDSISEQLDTLSALLSACYDEIDSDEDLELRMQIIDELYSYSTDTGDIATQFAELIADRVYEYESKTIVIPELSHGELLSFLLKNKNMKQSDLKFIASQSVISDVVNGKRKLTVEQIKKISSFFEVPSSVFI